jgi:exosome complex component RRP46
VRQIILINNFPRTAIQIILQITVVPENEYVTAKLIQSNVVRMLPHNRAIDLEMLTMSLMLQNLPVLPALLQTAILSLLSASLPMTATLTSTSLAIMSNDGHRQIVTNPTAREIEQSESFHVLAFTSNNELILAESEGGFTMNEWDDLYSAAYGQCCTTATIDDADIPMEEGLPTGADLKRFIRSTVEQKTASDLYWK